MTSIFGTSTVFDSAKVQNQSATPGHTNFNGVLTVNGAAIQPTTIPLSTLSNQTEPLAVAGQRDLWQQTNHLGSLVNYFAGPDLLYMADWQGFNTYYSHNGGVSFTACTFDVAPSFDVIIGYNGAGLWVGIEDGLTTLHTYTSSDGKSFTHNVATVACVGNLGGQILWAPGPALFIAFVQVDATHWVITSPDGITWTPRTTPNMGSGGGNFGLFATDGTTIVLAGVTSANSTLWTTNGTTWNVATGAPAVSSVAPCYSPDRAEWYLQDQSGNSYRSLNGQSWTSVGALGTPGSSNTIWVGAGINMYYQAGLSSANANHLELFASPNLSTKFVGAVLDGGISAPSGYNTMVYLPSYSSFFIGSEDTASSYSTARPFDLKVVSDNVRIRGFPVMTAMYALSSSATPIANTTVETSMLTGATSIGSLVIPASQPVGMTLLINFGFIFSSTAGDTLTIRLKAAGTSVLILTLTIPSLSGNLTCSVNTVATVQTAAIRFITNTSVAGTLSTASNSAGFSHGQDNPLTLTAQWGANVNSCTLHSMSIAAMFPNGA